MTYMIFIAAANVRYDNLGLEREKTNIENRKSIVQIWSQFHILFELDSGRFLDHEITSTGFKGTV